MTADSKTETSALLYNNAMYLYQIYKTELSILRRIQDRPLQKTLTFGGRSPATDLTIIALAYEQKLQSTI